MTSASSRAGAIDLAPAAERIAHVHDIVQRLSEQDNTMLSLLLQIPRMARSEFGCEPLSLKWQRTLNFYTALYGPSGLPSPDNLFSLALIHEAMDAPAEAEMLMREAIDAAGSGSQVDLAKMEMALADNLMQQSRAAEALPLILSSIDRHIEHYGENHLALDAPLLALEVCFSRMGRINETTATRLRRASLQDMASSSPRHLTENLLLSKRG